MWRTYPLSIGLPQTNFRGFAESRLLMEACHLFWAALGEAIGTPVSRLRNASGAPVYATIAFVEERYPADRTLEIFTLDDRLTVMVGLRFTRNVAVEARVLFDREDRLKAGCDPEAAWEQGTFPRVRFSSMFASPANGGRDLVLAAPANATFKELPVLPLEAHASPLLRLAQETGRLEVIPSDWESRGAAVETPYEIDPDRDTNAAGLVYFANYVSFLELGERRALASGSSGMSEAALAGRRLRERRVAYLGNASPTDRLTIAVSRWGSTQAPGRIGLRGLISREGEMKPLCVSESIVDMPIVRNATQPDAAVSLGRT